MRRFGPRAGLAVGAALVVGLIGCNDATSPDEAERGDVVTSAEGVPPDGFDTRPLPPEVAAQLESDEPLPEPVPLPMAPPTSHDPRAAYLATVMEREPVVLVLHVREVESVPGGVRATADVLRASKEHSAFRTGAAGPEVEVFLPQGLSCQGIADVVPDEWILIHLDVSDLVEARGGMVRVLLDAALPAVARVEADGDHGYRVLLPWGAEDYGALLQEVEIGQ